MLLLAVLAASGVALARQAGALPHRVVFSRMVLTAALTGGGSGYLLLSPALAWMALVSLPLPLMLIWVPGMGLWLSSADRLARQTAASRPLTITQDPAAWATARPATR